MLFRQGVQHCFLERPTLLQAGYWPLEAPRPHVTGGASLGVLNCALADAQLSSLVPRRPGQDKEEMAEKATAPTSSLRDTQPQHTHSLNCWDPRTVGSGVVHPVLGLPADHRCLHIEGNLWMGVPLNPVLLHMGTGN